MREKQRQIIKDFSEEVYGSASSRKAFIGLADQWDLASNFERLLGAEGRISFPVEKPQVDIGNIKGELVSFESLLRRMYGTERFHISVDAPSNKLEIVVWDYKEGEKIVRRSYNKVLDFLYRKSQESDRYLPYTQSHIVYEADRIAQTISKRSVKQKGTLYISALPEDILTASINLQGWSSCFDNEGENSVTPYHLVRSRRTLIAFFIPDNSDDITMEYCDHEVYNKYWRTFIYQTTDGSFFASSQAYPEQSDALTIAALTKLAKLDGREATVSDGFSVRYNLHGYYDGLGFAAVFNHDLGTVYQISSPHELCPISKQPYNNFLDQSITCQEHTDGHTCYACGDFCLDDELSRVVVSSCGNEEYYCEWCMDSVGYCEHSDQHYDTDHDSDTVSKFIDIDGYISHVITHYARTYLDGYTLTLYTDSETYDTYHLYGEGVHGLMDFQQVVDILGSGRPPSYKLAILTKD